MSSDVVPIRGRFMRLSKEEAERWIRAIVLDSARVGETDHVRDQMVERDISSRQVWEVLKGGSVVKAPKWDKEHEDWVCVMRKRAAGRTVSVVVALETKTRMTVVTTYG